MPTTLLLAPRIFRPTYGPDGSWMGREPRKKKTKMQTLKCTVHKTVGHKNSFGNLTDFFLVYCYSPWGKKFQSPFLLKAPPTCGILYKCFVST